MRLSSFPVPKKTLQPEAIVETALLLRARMAERFPEFGLRQVVGEVAETARGAGARAEYLVRPLLSLRALALLGLIYSLWTFEERLKRREALALLHELSALAHVVDMHQLTKAPSVDAPRTASSPLRGMSRADLGRYLDYCGEALTLNGKIAAVYAPKVQDPVVLEAVDGIEDLTTGLARKVWQKLAILQAVREAP